MCRVYGSSFTLDAMRYSSSAAREAKRQIMDMSATNKEATKA